jgi:prepilin-type processing-associated H-X9-DG protein
VSPTVSETPLMTRLTEVIAVSVRDVKRVRSASNLNQIAQGIALYQADHKDEMPSTLDALVESGALNKELLACPLAGADMKQPHYVYQPLPPNAPPALVLAYEQAELNDNKGANVLYADGHVEWVTAEKLKEDLAKTEKWLAENK